MPEDETTARMLEFICTENEVEILGIVREASGNSDPKINDRQRAAVTEAFAK
jgi:hypothetical protein